MNKRGRIVLGGLLTALVAATMLGAQAVYADSATPPAPPDERSGAPGGAADGQMAGPRGHRGLGPAELDAAATAHAKHGESMSSKMGQMRSPGLES